MKIISVIPYDLSKYFNNEKELIEKWCLMNDYLHYYLKELSNIANHIVLAIWKRNFYKRVNNVRYIFFKNIFTFSLFSIKPSLSINLLKIIKKMSPNLVHFWSLPHPYWLGLYFNVFNLGKEIITFATCTQNINTSFYNQPSKAWFGIDKLDGIITMALKMFFEYKRRGINNLFFVPLEWILSFLNLRTLFQDLTKK